MRTNPVIHKYLLLELFQFPRPSTSASLPLFYGNLHTCPHAGRPGPSRCGSGPSSNSSTLPTPPCKRSNSNSSRVGLCCETGRPGTCNCSGAVQNIGPPAFQGGPVPHIVKVGRLSPVWLQSGLVEHRRWKLHPQFSLGWSLYLLEWFGTSKKLKILLPSLFSLFWNLNIIKDAVIVCVHYLGKEKQTKHE